MADSAEFSVDIRFTQKINHDKLIENLQHLLGDDFSIEVLINKKPVVTDVTDPFVKTVDRIIGIRRKNGNIPKALPYFTDGSALQEYYKGTPTIILGPGDPRLAHKTDEYCSVKSITDAEKYFIN